jgi:hypothetical protein
MQLAGQLDVLQPGIFRQALGVRIGFEVLDRSQFTPSPTHPMLDQVDRLSFHGWLEPGYEIYWFKGHVALQASALLGAQTFDAGIGAGPRIAYGIAVAPELRIGASNGTGVSIGIKYRAASMTRPVFPYEGFETHAKPERALQHFLLLYAGMYFSFFGS